MHNPQQLLMFLLSNSRAMLHPAITAHLLTSCGARTRGECRGHQSRLNSPQASPAYLPLVEADLAAVRRYSKPERGDGVHAAVYL